MEWAGDNMIYNDSERKKQDELLEDELMVLKKEYYKPQMPKEQLEELRRKIERAGMENRKQYNKGRIIKVAAAVAACIGAFVILPNTSGTVAHAMGELPVIGELVKVVTFRDYEYKTDRNMADIDVPELTLDEQAADSGVKEKLEGTTDEINAEIKQITDKLVKEFKANLEDEEGYQDVVVKSEVLTTKQDYFTLKLICYQGAGSGYQWNYYYTIDLNTGERMQLKDIFDEGTDYITPISENIKEQMQAQMAADKNVYYWLNDEVEEWNFKAITEKNSFYLNEKDNVVIGFDEGEVAPMYMGAVEFEIPAQVLRDIRK